MTSEPTSECSLCGAVLPDLAATIAHTLLERHADVDITLIALDDLLLVAYLDAQSLY